MAITDLLPWKKNEEQKLAVRRSSEPAMDLYQEMDRFFDNFFSDPFRLPSSRLMSLAGGSFMPRVDLSENGKEIVVKAEMPGMDENDVQVSFSKGVLSIYGEKHEEKEDKDRRYHRIERSFGSFRREVEIPAAVEEDNISATFKKGVLTVVLPKSTRAEVLGRRINVIRG
jgi:HSP20 family protein